MSFIFEDSSLPPIGGRESRGENRWKNSPTSSPGEEEKKE